MHIWDIWDLEYELCFHNRVLSVSMSMWPSLWIAQEICLVSLCLYQFLRSQEIQSSQGGSEAWTLCHLLILESLSWPPPCSGPAPLHEGGGGTESHVQGQSGRVSMTGRISSYCLPLSFCIKDKRHLNMQHKWGRDEASLFPGLWPGPWGRRRNCPSVLALEVSLMSLAAGEFCQSTGGFHFMIPVIHPLNT